MTDPTDLSALLTRLAADAPDPTLNEDIARALGWVGSERSPWWRAPRSATNDWHMGPPDFLTDVNAALAEVPPDSFLNMLTGGASSEVFQAVVKLPNDRSPSLEYFVAPTLARALVGAVLRARGG